MSLIEKPRTFAVPIARVPECVYCRKPMRRVLTEYLCGEEVRAQFECECCGWEAAAPSA